MVEVLKGLDKFAGVQEVAGISLFKLFHVGDRNKYHGRVFVINGLLYFRVVIRCLLQCIGVVVAQLDYLFRKLEKHFKEFTGGRDSSPLCFKKANEVYR